jgi:hypothetical protein
MSEISLDTFDADIACPTCKFINTFSFKQARLRDVIICRGCKANIQLDDRMNECRKAERDIRRAFGELTRSLGSLKLEIKI